MPHQLVDHPGRDATILQPGREGAAQIMGPCGSSSASPQLSRRRAIAVATGSAIGSFRAAAGSSPLDRGRTSNEFPAIESGV